MPQDQLTLSVTTRPVRILSVVRTRDEITLSTRLFTHLWGGAANVILPYPSEHSELERFGHAIGRYDPDHVLTPADMSPEVQSLLQSIPCYQDRLTERSVLEHINGPNLFHFRRGDLAHVGRVLQQFFPTGFPETSTIRVLQSGSPHAFALGLHYGNPTEIYSTFLQRFLRGRQLNAPQTYLDLLKTLLIDGDRLTPIAVTITNLRVSVSHNLSARQGATALSSMRADRELTLFIFLDDGEDVALPCLFWNSRRNGQDSNKLFLPRDLVLANLQATIDTIRLARRFDELAIVTRTTELGARDLKAQFQATLVAAGVEAAVAVYYQGFDYEMPVGTLRSGSPEAMTRIADEEGAVRFSPSAPVGGNIGATVFGFDAIVEHSNGAKLSLPSAHWTSVILQNPLWRLIRAEQNEAGHGRMWLHHLGAPAIRAVPAGIAGVTTVGEECGLFIHSDDLVITQLLKQHGLRIRSNTHTLYAAGFARKFGGISKTLTLVRQGGARIIRALSAKRAGASGFAIQEVRAFLHRQYRMSNEDATTLLSSKLPELCAAGLVRRGAALTCNHCGLREWYSVDALSEFIECAGCAQEFQLSPPGVQYSYRANELSRRFIRSGGHAVLMTAAGLRRMEASGAMQFGGDVFREGENANFAEIDLVLVTSHTTVVAECKDYEKDMTDDDVRSITLSLQRNVVAAVAVGASIIILGITGTQMHADLYDAAQRVGGQIRPLGIALHMLVNDKLHHGCSPSGVELRGMSLERLKLGSGQSTPPATHVGDLRNSIGFGFSRRGDEEGPTVQWEAELGA